MFACLGSSIIAGTTESRVAQRAAQRRNAPAGVRLRPYWRAVHWRGTAPADARRARVRAARAASLDRNARPTLPPPARASGGRALRVTRRTGKGGATTHQTTDAGAAGEVPLRLATGSAALNRVRSPARGRSGERRASISAGQSRPRGPTPTTPPLPPLLPLPLLPRPSVPEGLLGVTPRPWWRTEADEQETAVKGPNLRSGTGLRRHCRR